jgi:RNA polymerase sigma factor (sigma-70 family)
MDSMPPPPAELFASRVFLGPALRAQPDRRLVTLVREGYEAAFEEIVRRYRKPLDRFAAAIVGGRSEDVTQDAFSKALLALRGSEAEIELRPWLYRIVRNTALNDLRDGPPAAEELGETIAGGRSAAVEAERREEIADLMGRLRALPEPQRAAIVMRELEGLSHEEIAAALGVSGGAARQAIYRARVALRNGLGLLVPMPLLRLLFDHGAEAAEAGTGGAVAAAAAATSAGGGAGAALGGLGAGGALKVGVATALVAGSVGAGVAMQEDRDAGSPGPAAAALLPGGGSGQGPSSGASSSGSERGSSGGSGENSGPGGAGEDDDRDEGTSGGSHSGRQSSGDDDSGDGGGEDSHSGSSSSGSGSGSSSSGTSGSGSSGSGSSGSSTATIAPLPTTEPSLDDGGDSSGSGSGDLDLGDSSGSGSGGDS